LILFFTVLVEVEKVQLKTILKRILFGMEGVVKFQLDVGPEIFRGAIGWGLDNSSLCS
jgi:hypothetical protein